MPSFQLSVLCQHAVGEAVSVTDRELCGNRNSHKRPVSTNPLCNDKQWNENQDPWILGSNPVWWLSHFTSISVVLCIPLSFC